MRTLISLLILAGATFLSGALPAAAAPGDDIGATVRIVNLVTGSYEKDQRNLATGDSVRQDELIEVGADGIGEIRLNDDTELALGPGARLKLDQFVYDPDISGGAIVVNLVRGAFRFITGIAAKPAYVIRTPTAAITVRGTIFDVYVELSGISWLLLIEGGIEVCNEKRQCNLLDEPGKLIRITPDGFVSEPAVWSDLPTGGLPFKTAFPFIVTPPQIDPEPEFTPEDIVEGRVPDGPPVGDDDDDKDDGDVADDDTGPEPPDSGPPLHCWKGWEEVPKGWHKDGWSVKHRRRGNRVIRCAHEVEEPPHGGGGGVVIPIPPQCHGGKTVLLKTFPPRWRCICPDGKKRHRIGPHAFVCKGKPGGGGGPSPKEKCLKKGWKWTGSLCIPKLGKCKNGYVGKWPNCKKIVEPPKKCPLGFVGKPPHCHKLEIKPKKCPNGTFGKWPNCKDGKLKQKKVIKDFKKALEKFKLKKKDQ
jgi:FecR protein